MSRLHESQLEDMSMSGENVAILVAWPYGNGPRHLGHGASLVPGDVLARYFRSRGANVLMVSGTDEYGTPNLIAAEKAGVEPQDYVTQTNEQIREDFIGLGMSFDWFTRTTSPEHAKIAQEVFTKLFDHEFIEKGTMLGAFDTVTEQALPDRYIEGECPYCSAHSRGDQCEECTSLLDPSELINPVSKVTGNTVQFRDVEHYFLMLDRLAPDVKSWLDEHSGLRSNAKAMSNEMVKDLRPRAITRDMEWGVKLPNGFEYEDEKVMYVWFEAVIGYLSASIEWAKHSDDPENWRKWWENTSAQHHYVMGKDNVPFHTIVWPAIISGMQKSGYERMHQPDSIASTEYLNFKDGKFSSSRGNTVYVSDMLRLVGPDALRYYLLAAGPETSDVTFSFDQLSRRVNDELIAKWGNLVSRTINLVGKHFDGQIPETDLAGLGEADQTLLGTIRGGYGTIATLLDQDKFSGALKEFMSLAGNVNKYIYDMEPWKRVKSDRENAARSLYIALAAIQNLATMAAPFMPHSSQEIYERLGGEGELASHPYNLALDPDNAFQVLTGDYMENESRWRFTLPSMGRTLITNRPHLFKKIDTVELVDNFEKIVKYRSLGKQAINTLTPKA